MILAVYQKDVQDTTVQIAYDNVSKYMHAQYIVGTLAPLGNVNIPFTPFVAVIDLDDGKVLARDTDAVPLELQDILNKVNLASTN
ncbi:MAG: hypothetical protein PHU25_11290 [Deltaproteobacteria bacterium]|nr:hypothetical protein [Deltaproteobacteria bacterium]